MLAALAVLLGALASPGVAWASAQTSNALVAGKVLVCNTPGRCLTRVFRVVAVDGAGHVVAHVYTSGTANTYLLHVAAGDYALIATSNGLRCRGSVAAVARRRVTANITCLVP